MGLRAHPRQSARPRLLAYALEDQEAVIDAATARATDSESVYRIDWDGKLNLYNQCRAKGVRRVVFTSFWPSACPCP